MTRWVLFTAVVVLVAVLAGPTTAHSDLHNLEQTDGESAHGKGHTCVHDAVQSHFADQVDSGHVEHDDLSGRHTDVHHEATGHKLRIKAYGDGFQSIRIHGDYARIQSNADSGKACYSAGQTVTDWWGNSVTCGSDDVLSSAQRTFLQNTLVPQAITWFENTLSLARVSGNLVLPGAARCSDIPSISSTYTSSGIANTDFIVFVTARPTQGSTLATASWCKYDSTSGRSLAAQINFGPSHVDTDPARLQYQLATALHELTHAIAFSSGLFQLFKTQSGGSYSEVQSTETLYSHTVKKIKTPTVVAKARAHFGCTSLDGLETEDYNGGSSHWEKRLLANEFMTPSNGGDSVYSAMTLALFEDTGWYTANYNSVNSVLIHGNQQGCTFAQGRCSQWPATYFCNDPGKGGCSVNGKKGYCSLTQWSGSLPSYYQYFGDPSYGGSDAYADYCPLWSPYSNGDCGDLANEPTQYDATKIFGETYGAETMCFTSDIIASGYSGGSFGGKCFKQRCNNGQLQFNVGGNWYTCPVNGGDITSISGFSGKVVCPPTSQVCVASKPGTPNAPTCGGTTQSSIDLNWAAPSNDGGSPVTGFKLYMNGGGSSTSFSELWSGSATSISVTQLPASASYQFKIVAINGIGDSAQSTAGTCSTQAAATAPSAPAAPSCSATGTTTISVNWNAPSSDGNSPVTKYRLYRNNAGSTSYNVLIHDQSGTSTTAIGLAPGTAYRFRVVAINSVGTSSYSSLSTTCTTNVAAPEKPGTPTCGSTTSSSIAVSWPAPSSTGGASATITAYKLFRNNGAGGTSHSSLVYTGSSPSTTVSGLNPGTTYTFKVTATNNAGLESAKSSKSSGCTTSVTPPSAPNAPLCGSSTANSITMSWSQPSNNGGASVTSYTLYRNNGGTGEATTSVYTGSSLSTTVSSLSPGAGYRFSVTATNSEGTSTKSSLSSECTTSSTAPSAPNTPTCQSATATTMALLWTPNHDGGSPITQYKLYRNSGGSSGSANILEYTGSSTSATVSGLSPNTQYKWLVEATNLIGSTSSATSSLSSACTTASSVPTAPAAPTCGAPITSSSLTVNWGAPSSNGGQPVSKYEVYRNAGTGSSSYSTLVLSVTNGVITGQSVTSLSPATQYKFKVRAINSVGSSTLSAASSGCSTSAVAPSAPSTPTCGSGSATSSAITISWSAPSQTGGASVSKYRVYRNTGGSDTSFTTQATETSSLSATISGLNPATSYAFRVTAINSAGESVKSGASSGCATLVGVPTAPTQLTCGGSTLTTATLSWSAPASTGGEAVTYELQRNNGGSSTTYSVAHTGSSLSAVVPSLAVNTNYKWKVAARNSAGDSAFTSTVTCATQAGAPSKPSAVSCAAGSDPASELDVSWTAPQANGSPVTRYVLKRNTGGSGAVNVQIYDGSALLSTASLLSPATSYQFTITAYNSIGSSTSTAKSCSTTAAVPSTMSAPTCSVIQGQPTKLKVSWVIPSGNGAAVSSIKVYRNTGGSDTSYTTVGATAGGSATTIDVTGLTRATMYKFKATATNSAGESAVSAASAGCTTPAEVPAPAGTPVCTDGQQGESSLAVTWPASSDNGGAAVSYTLSVNGGGSSTSYTTAYTGTATSATVIGLNPATTYKFKVVASNPAGGSTEVTSTDAKCLTLATKPATPAAPTCTGDSAPDELQLSWAAPSDTGGSPITRYVLYSNNGGTGSSATTEVFGGMLTSAPVSSLTPNTEYRFRVVAINARGASPKSPASALGCKTGPAAPSRPQSIDCSGATSSQTTITWTAPALDNGSPVSDYKLYRNDGNGGTSFVAAGTSGGALTKTVTGLTPGASYKFRVTAVNGVGESTVTQTPGTCAILATTPGAPSFATTPCSSETSSGVTVTWTAPSNTGGAAVTAYKVFRNAGGTSTDFSTVVHEGQSPASITGLQFATDYKFKVQAINSVGAGTLSSESSVCTTKATSPTGLAPPTCGATTSSSISLSWSAPSSTGGVGITIYKLSRTGAGGTGSHDTTSCNSPAASCTVSTLAPATVYSFKLQATNAEGLSVESAAKTCATDAATPGAAGAASCSDMTHQSAKVTWSAPSSDGGSAVTGYKVYRQKSGETSWTLAATLSSTTTSTTIASLSESTSYIFRVAAVNAVGDGTPGSASSGCSTTAKPVNVPDAPTGVQCSSPSSSGMTITWTQPANTGGSPITGFRVFRAVSPFTDYATLAVEDVSSTATTTTASGLNSNTEYRFKVLVMNSAGSGALSEATPTCTTLATIPSPPASGPVCSNPTASSVTLSWNAPANDGGSSVTSYDVYQRTSGGADSLAAGGSGVTSLSNFVVTGLSSSTAYIFTVKAKNSIGTSATASPVSTGSCETVVQTSAPTVPQSVTCSASSGTQISVSWQAPSDTGNSPITAYEVLRVDNNDVTNTGTVLSHNAPGLTANTEYSFKVKATNQAGLTGAYSAAKTCKTFAVPRKPTIACGSTKTSDSLIVNWVQPASDSAVTKYTIERDDGAGGAINVQAYSGLPTGDLEATITGLLHNRNYKFTLVATSSVGSSVKSDATTCPTDAGPPGAVSNFQCGTATKVSLPISWTAPTDDGGANIYGHDIYYTAANGNTLDNWLNAGPSSSTTVPNLTGNANYKLKVRAKNSKGEGPFSAVISCATAPIPPTMADKPSCAVLSSSSIKVSWTAPIRDGGAPIASFEVWKKQGAEASYSAHQTVGASARSVTLTSLAPGETFTFKVLAKNSADEITAVGDVQATDTCTTPATLPGAPANLACGTVQAKSIDLTWSAPASDGGSPVTQYAVKRNGGVDTDVLSATTAQTSASVTGLIPNTEYTFTVTAENTPGVGPASSTATCTTAKDAPSAPDAPSCTSVQNTPTSLKITWTAPAHNHGSPVTLYELYQAAAGAGSFTKVAGTSLGASDREFTITGLTLSTSYTFKVAATNGIGTTTSTASTGCTTGATKADPPTNLACTNKRDTSIDFTWDAPASDGGTPVTGYQIFRDDPPTAVTSLTQLTYDGKSDTARAGTASGLTPFTEYEFSVSALNSAGLSSGSVSLACKTTAAPPGAPGAPQCSDMTPTSIKLTWTAPTLTNGAAVTKYTVFQSKNGGAFVPLGNQPTTTSVTITGLDNAESYTFQVAATNSVGTGPSSAASSTCSTNAAEPGRPAKPTCSSPAATAMTLAWALPGDDGGSPVTAFKVYRTDAGGSTATTLVLDDTTRPGGQAIAMSTTASSLVPFSDYKFSVTAVSAIGSSQPSPLSDVCTTLADAPTAPAAPACASTGATTSSLGLSWTAPTTTNGGAITTYTVLKATTADGTYSEAFTGNVLTTTITGLDGGTQYYFKVKATNAEGKVSEASAASAATNCVTTAVKPSAPSSPATCDATTSSTVTLVWTPPTKDGGSPITGYKVETSLDGQTGWTEAPHGTVTDLQSGDKSATVTGLTAGTSYFFRLAAVNAVGTGTFGPRHTCNTAAATESPPSAPAAPQCDSSTVSSVTVTWKLPTDTGSSPVTEYKLYQKDVTDPVYTGSDVQATISSLTASSAYSFQVTAANSKGTSAKSEWSLSCGTLAPTPTAAPTATPTPTPVTTTPTPTPQTTVNADATPTPTPDPIPCTVACVHGTCDERIGQCVCFSGFDGDTCADRLCMGGCVNGVCDKTTGTCSCQPKFGGKACDVELKECPDNCNGAGACDQETFFCTCNRGFSGDACEIRECPNKCSGHGACNPSTGQCACEKGWGAADCGTDLVLTVPLGVEVNATVANNTYSYFRVKLQAAQDADVIIQLLAIEGDPNMYLSHRAQFPTRHDFTWSSSQKGSESYMIKSSDRELRAATLYIGVTGRAGPARFFLTVSEQVRLNIPTTCPLNCNKRGSCIKKGNLTAPACDCDAGWNGLGCEIDDSSTEVVPTGVAAFQPNGGFKARGKLGKGKFKYYLVEVPSAADLIATLIPSKTTIQFSLVANHESDRHPSRLIHTWKATRNGTRYNIHIHRTDPRFRLGVFYLGVFDLRSDDTQSTTNTSTLLETNTRLRGRSRFLQTGNSISDDALFDLEVQVEDIEDESEFSDAICPAQCKVNGYCEQLRCVCDAGWSGENCEVKKRGDKDGVLGKVGGTKVAVILAAIGTILVLSVGAGVMYHMWKKHHVGKYGRNGQGRSGEGQMSSIAAHDESAQMHATGAGAEAFRGMSQIHRDTAAEQAVGRESWNELQEASTFTGTLQAPEPSVIHGVDVSMINPEIPSFPSIEERQVQVDAAEAALREDEPTPSGDGAATSAEGTTKPDVEL